MADEIDSKDDEEQGPLWMRPTIHQPIRGTTVQPLFQVQAEIQSSWPSKWQLKIMEGDKQVYFVETGADGKWFIHNVGTGVIKPGSKFIVHVHYFAFPAWSEWHSVGDLVMADYSPVITEPAEGSVTISRPTFIGRGAPGATIKLYEAYSGVVLYGTAVVDGNGDWQILTVYSLPRGPVVMVVSQTIGNIELWSNNVPIIANPIPVIETPKYGDRTNKRPTFAGQGTAGSTIKLYEAKSGVVLYGTAVVDAGGTWRITPEVDLPVREIDMIVNQFVANREFWSNTVKIYVNG